MVACAILHNPIVVRAIAVYAITVYGIVLSAIFMSAICIIAISVSAISSIVVSLIVVCISACGIAMSTVVIGSITPIFKRAIVASSILQVLLSLFVYDGHEFVGELSVVFAKANLPQGRIFRQIGIDQSDKIVVYCDQLLFFVNRLQLHSRSFCLLITDLGLHAL